MDIRTVKNNAFNIYRSKKTYAWSLAIVMAFFAGVMCLTGLLTTTLYYFVVPIVILPVMYSCLMIFLYMKNENVELNFRNIWKFVKVYFNPAYRGVFKVFMTFLKSLIASLIASTIGLLVCYLVYRFGYTDFYNQTMNTINEWFNNPEITTTMDELIESVITANDGLINDMLCYTELAVSGVSLVTFVTVTSYEACYLPIRSNIKTNNFMVFRNALRDLTKKIKKEVIKAYIKLNFLIPILLIIGYGLGFVLTLYLPITQISQVIAVCTACAFVPLVFFFPFYLSNMEALGYEYRNDIDVFTARAQEEEIRIREQNVKMMEEYAQRMRNELNEENKKDSEES